MLCLHILIGGRGAEVSELPQPGARDPHLNGHLDPLLLMPPGTETPSSSSMTHVDSISNKMYT